MSWLVRDGDVLAAVELADTAGARRRGLLHRESFDGALVLRPCRHVHTAGMRFPIDVVYLDRDQHVVHVEENLKPWRLAKVSMRTASVLELPGNTLKSSGTAVGDEIEIAVNGISAKQPSEATTA